MSSDSDIIQQLMSYDSDIIKQVMSSDSDIVIIINVIIECHLEYQNPHW